MSTLKDILDDVLDDDNLTIPSAYATNSQPEYRRLVRHTNKAVKDILAVHDWTLLKKRGTITVVDGTTLYDLPSDYSHIINDTAQTGSIVNDTYFPANDELIAITDVHNVLIDVGRFIGGQIELLNFSAGTFYFTYMSKGAVTNNETSTDSDKFIADKDTWLLDDELLVRAIIWRYKKSEGADDWQVAVNDFKGYLKVMKTRDVGARTIGKMPFNYVTPPYMEGTT